MKDGPGLFRPSPFWGRSARGAGRSQTRDRNEASRNKVPVPSAPHWLLSGADSPQLSDCSGSFLLVPRMTWRQRGAAQRGLLWKGAEGSWEVPGSRPVQPIWGSRGECMGIWGIPVQERDCVLTIQDDSHRPEVHTGIVLPLAHHLWGHVERRASQHMLLSPWAHVLCKAKVCGQRPGQRTQLSLQEPQGASAGLPTAPCKTAFPYFPPQHLGTSPNIFCPPLS